MAGKRDGKQIAVLFVCLGNICRSPMAEGVFRRLTRFGTPEQHPLISDIDSCGTGAYHAGSQPDERTLQVLKEHGIEDYTHAARKFHVPRDLDKFDYVLAMDEDNLMDLTDTVRQARKRGRLSGDSEKKLYLYGSFGGKHSQEEVGDPYYGGMKGFEICYEQVTRFGEGLLAHIERDVRGEIS